MADAGGGDGDPIPSGPLHDATEIGRIVPTAMIFAQSDPPLSHAAIEDSTAEALRAAIDAYGRTVAWALDERTTVLQGGVADMNFGVVLQTNPPAARVIELARQAETYGFTHAWTFDSHLLWEEPFVIYSRILDCHPQADRRADGHQPRDPRLDRHRVAVRDAERDVWQPDDLRHGPR